MRLHQRRRRRFPLLLRLVITLGLAGVIVMLASYVYYLRFEPGRSAYPVHGVDVSQQQGAIDWDAVSEEGVKFVYMKATEGGDVKDARFRTNWMETARAGMPRGAYHFFTLCGSGAEQASNFMDSVPAEEAALPPAVALEFGGGCDARPDTTEILRELLVCLNRLERHYGKKPVIYVTGEFYRAYLQSMFEDYAFWLRGIIFKPDYGPSGWAIWQFHDKGQRAGIETPVNLNVFGPGTEAFEEFRRSGRLAGSG